MVCRVLPLQARTGRGKLCQICYSIQYQEKWVNFHLNNVLPKGSFRRREGKEIPQSLQAGYLLEQLSARGGNESAAKLLNPPGLCPPVALGCCTPSCPCPLSPGPRGLRAAGGCGRPSAQCCQRCGSTEVCPRSRCRVLRAAGDLLLAPGDPRSKPAHPNRHPSLP